MEGHLFRRMMWFILVLELIVDLGKTESLSRG